jgi:hypothetical protein
MQPVLRLGGEEVLPVKGHWLFSLSASTIVFVNSEKRELKFLVFMSGSLFATEIDKVALLIGKGEE